MLNYDPFRIAEAHLELWNKRNLIPLKELLAPTATLRFVFQKEEKPAVKLFEEYAKLLHDVVPDVKVTILDIIPAPGVLTLEWVLTGTHKGVFKEIKPTGLLETVKGVVTMKVNEDGKVTKEVIHLDLAALVEKIGIVPKPVEEKKLREITLGIVELINKRDEKVLTYLAPEYTIVMEKFPKFEQPMLMPTLLRALVAFPDIKIQPVQVAVRNNEVVLEAIATATHTGPLFQKPATNKPVKIEFVAILTFVEEKITRIRLYPDVINLFTTIGLIPELVVR
ncbi:MAG TPA: ester cyclase [Symbiobacteriaceae bacterium]|nr:ester cyclase [Symbiobacteriaceae bacterium]